MSGRQREKLIRSLMDSNMIPELYNHQKQIISEDKKKFGIFTGTGSAKTRTALELGEGSVLVICPKQQRDDETWQRNARAFDIITNLTVVSKEDFKKVWDTLPPFDTVIIDECHTVLGVTADTRQVNKQPVPKTSQIFEAVYNFLKKNPPKRFYPCSATPVSKPMNLWAVAKLLGVNWDYFGFRAKYYFEVRMGARRVWLPKRDKETKDQLAELVKKLGYVGSLNDFFDVPEQTHKEVFVELTKGQKDAIAKLNIEEADPLVRRARTRTIENGILYAKKVESKGKMDTMVKKTEIFPSEKIDYIIERAYEFPKLLIFANYTAQILEIEKALKKEGFNVSTLTGKTKDRTFIKKVDESPEPHIVVAQSSVSAGYELPSFPCVIFASKSWKYVDYEQGLGRVLRSNKLKKNLYIHLLVKGVDSDCHDTILSGADFQERLSTQDDVDSDTCADDN